MKIFSSINKLQQLLQRLQMDEFDSIFSQIMLQSEESYLFLLSESQITPEHKDQIVVDTRQQDEQPQQVTIAEGKKRNRDDNTVFKTPLSEFRKILLKSVKHCKACTECIENINKTKNYSTFPKLLLLSQKIGVKQKLIEPFRREMQKVLVKKKRKLPEKRYLELQNVYRRMTLSLEASKIQDSVQVYWGAYRQKGKFEKSFQEIEKFGNFLETIEFLHLKNVQQNSN